MHWQNLNEGRTDANGNTPLGFPWHGRAWLGRWHVEWALGGARTGFSLRFDEEGAHAMLAVPLVSLFFGCEALRRSYKLGERELSLRIHDWAIWWKAWSPPSEWSSGTPKYRDGCFHIDDFVLGKQRYATRDLSYRWIAVPMPERTYFGCAKLFESTWSRPRWFARKLIRCEIEMLPGEQIPHPGKGENSWDCGEDATFGICAPATSIDDGIGGLVGSVLRSRTRHGGRDWAPESKAPDLGGALPVQP